MLEQKQALAELEASLQANRANLSAVAPPAAPLNAASRLLDLEAVSDKVTGSLDLDAVGDFVRVSVRLAFGLVPAEHVPAVWAGVAGWGLRDRSDPSYAVLGAIGAA